MSGPQQVRDLNRLKWATMVLPVVFVWVFELVRFLVLDPRLTGDEGHVASAMIMGAAIVAFATVVSVYLDRTQKQLVAQNKDLTVTHAVSSAVRGGLSLPDLLEQALDRVITQTGALAGVVSISTADGAPLTIRRPAVLAPGLGWLGPILAEPADPALDAPRYSRRMGVDTGILDLALIRGLERLGHVRLVFHPPVEPDISDAAFVDIAGEIAGAAQLGRTLADLHRREREREALYEVALQLTGRGDLGDVLDTITGHARDLLGAERAVACLSDPREAEGKASAVRDRLAMADDGSVCHVAHAARGAAPRPEPHVPAGDRPRDRELGIAAAARPRRRPGRAVRRARRGGRSAPPSATSWAPSPTWPRSPCGRPGCTRPRSSGRSMPSATGSRASSTTASPRSWASSTSSSGRSSPAPWTRRATRWRASSRSWPRRRTRRTRTCARRSSASGRPSARTAGWRARCASTCASTAARPGSPPRSRATATRAAG